MECKIPLEHICGAYVGYANKTPYLIYSDIITAQNVSKWVSICHKQVIQYGGPKFPKWRIGTPANQEVDSVQSLGHY